MSGRRRSSAGATLAAVAGAVTIVVSATACGSDASDAVPAATSVSSTIAATTSTATTSTTTTSTSSTTTTTTATTTTTVPEVVCPALEIVVLGNSTDYWPNFVVGVDEPTDDAWPAVLESLLRQELPDTQVVVENGSVLGAGFDIGLFGVTSMGEQLERLVALPRDTTTVLLLAPSVVDLQLRSLDVGASFTAFVELNRRAASSFDTVRVLPMNPVAVGFDPEVARAVDDFNRRLADAALIDVDDASPLLLDEGPFGRPEFYDDFDDGRLDTPGPDPDGLHPDVDGHLTIAVAVAAQVTSMVPAVCA